MMSAYLACIYYYVFLRFIRKNARHIAQSTWSKHLCALTKRVLPTAYMCPVKLPRSITLIASQFAIAVLLTLSEVVNFFTLEDLLDKLEQFYDADDGDQD